MNNIRPNNTLMNIKSLLKSGFVAGFIINISAIAMVPMVGDQFDTVLASRNLPPLNNMAMLFFCGLSFVMGFFLVWLYALAKNQIGPGMKTAAFVSIVFWFFAYLVPNVSMVVYGFMPIRLTVIGTGWGLVELLVASTVGSRLYKDIKN